MAREGYFATNLGRDLSDGNGLPVISQDLDSVRAYQWEVTFFPPAEVEVPQTFSKPLTLAAKQINGLETQVEDIEVNRTNDKVYYPGRPSTSELVVTFDNLRKPKTAFQLYKYYQSVYDPVTGEFTTSFLQSPGAFKSNADVVELDAKGDPLMVTKLIGIWPKRFVKAEKNYATNDFDTLEVTFRYDFLIQQGDPS